MKTLEMYAVTDDLKTNFKMKGKAWMVSLSVLSLLILSTGVIFAHCDTMDGPVIKDAKIAIERNNINYALKWVQPQYETELKDVFGLTMKVRTLSHEAAVLADRYFFETLVRLHRSGEGVPYTGVKASGIPVDEKILAADKSVELGNISPLKELVPEEILPELEERFTRVMALRNFDVNNVKAGREYIEAYVQFFKFAEGEEENHNTVNQEGISHSAHQH